jgi:uncharacterized membrane protein YgdD (TMEM256/DUF423 family)
MTNRTLQKRMFQTGCIFAALAVMLGAFGAHGLRGASSAADVAVFETGVKYQFIHALSILMLSFAIRRLKEKTLLITFRLFVAGIILFSFSLYFLAIRSILGIGDQLNWIGAITPFGGLSFIAGWIYMAYDGYKSMDGEEHSSKRHHGHSSRSNQAA